MAPQLSNLRNPAKKRFLDRWTLQLQSTAKKVHSHHDSSLEVRTMDSTALRIPGITGCINQRYYKLSSETPWVLTISTTETTTTEQLDDQGIVSDKHIDVRSRILDMIKNREKYVRTEGTMTSPMKGINKGTNDIVCNVCAKRFIRQRELTIHSRIHTGEKLIHCKVCSKSFTCNKDLRVHSVVHLDDQHLECSKCNISFKAKKCLKMHLRRHDSEGRFECEQCQKVFTQKSYLVDHMKNHLTRKPYQCKTCQKHFARASHRNRHELTHGEKKLGCNACPARFHLHQCLREHINKHH